MRKPIGCFKVHLYFVYSIENELEIRLNLCHFLFVKYFLKLMPSSFVSTLDVEMNVEPIFCTKMFVISSLRKIEQAFLPQETVFRQKQTEICKKKIILYAYEFIIRVSLNNCQ